MKDINSLPINTVLELYNLKKHAEANKDNDKLALLAKQLPSLFTKEIDELIYRLEAIACFLDAKYGSSFEQDMQIIIH